MEQSTALEAGAPPQPSAPPRRRRYVRRVAAGVCLLVGAGLGLLVGTHAGLEVLVDIALPLVNRSIQGSIALDAVHGRLLDRFGVSGLVIRDPEGGEAVRCQELSIDWTPAALLKKRLEVTAVHVVQPRVDLVIDDRGVNLARAFASRDETPTPPPETQSGGLELFVDEVRLEDGALSARTATAAYALEEVTLRAGYTGAGSVSRVHLETLAFQGRTPALGAVALDGDLVLDEAGMRVAPLGLGWGDGRLEVVGTVHDWTTPTLALETTLHGLDLARVSALLAPDTLKGVMEARAAVLGPLSDLRVVGGMTLPVGTARLEAAADLAAPVLSWRGRIETEGIDPAAVLVSPALPGRLNLRLEGHGTGTDPASLTAGVTLTARDSALLGWEVHRLEGTLEVAGGTWKVGRLEADTLYGRVLAAGETRLDDGRFTASLWVDAPRAGPVVERLSGTAMRGGIDADLALAGRWKDSLELDARGRVNAVAVALSPARLDRLDGTVDVRVREGKAYGGADLAVMGLEAAPVRIDRLEARVGLEGDALELAIDSGTGGTVSVNGRMRAAWSAAGTTVRAEPLELVVFGRRLASDGPLEVASRPEGISLARVRLQGESGAVQAGGVYRSGGASDVSVVLEHVDLGWLAPFMTAEAALGGRLDATARWKGTLAQPDLSMQLAGTELRYGAYGPLDLEGTLTTTPGVSSRVALSVATGEGPLFRLEGTLPWALALEGAGGRLRPEGPVAAALEVPEGALTRFSAVGVDLSALAPFSRGGGRLEVAGTGRAPRVSGQLALAEAAGGRAGEPPSPPRSGGEGRVRGPGDEPLALELQFADADGALSATSALRQGDTQRATLTLDLPIDLTDLIPQALAGVDVAGGLMARAGALRATLALTKLPLAVARGWVPSLETAEGQLSGQATLAGPLADVAMESRLELEQGVVEGVTLARAELEAQVGNGQARLSGALDPAAGGRLRIDGRAPLTLALDGSTPLGPQLERPGLEATVDGTGVPAVLAQAYVPDVEIKAGLLELKGRIDGTLAAPRLDFDTRLKEGGLCLEANGVCYDEMAAAVRLTRSRIDIRSLTFTSLPRDRYDALERTALKPAEGGKGGWIEALRRRFKGSRRVVEETLRKGRFSGKGRIDLDERWSLTDVDLKIAGTDLWVSHTSQADVRADADLRFTGRWPDLVARGSVEIPQARVHLGDEILRSTQGLELPADLVIHRPAAPGTAVALVGAAAPGAAGALGGPGAPAAAEDVVGPPEPGLLDRLKTELKVTLTRNVWLHMDIGLGGETDLLDRAANAFGRIKPDLQVRGELTVQSAGGDWLVLGDVQAVRGTLSIVGRKLVMQEGTVTFTGAVPPDPRLDLVAVYPSRYGEVQVNVEGTTTAPRVSFSSEAVSDPNDVLSILVTGKPIDELVSGQGTEVNWLSLLLTEAASGAAGAALDSLVGNNVVDLLNYDPGTEGMTSGSLEVGKNLSDRVLVILRYSPFADADTNSIEGKVEFQLTARTFLSTRFGDRGNGALELTWEKKF